MPFVKIEPYDRKPKDRILEDNHSVSFLYCQLRLTYLPYLIS